jgi:cohesin loading factor subunit SCC2
MKSNRPVDDLKQAFDLQSGMASSVIQIYLHAILESYVTPNLQQRISTVNCLNQILYQGLINPIECVPYLIAMASDTDKKIQIRSLYHLTNLEKSQPGFMHSKLIAGIKMSYTLHETIQNQDNQVNLVRGSEHASNSLPVGRNSNLYMLLRSNRKFYRAFIQQLLETFSYEHFSKHQPTLGYLFYTCDNLAYFPYKLIDEPLFVINQIDGIVSTTGVHILQAFEEYVFGANKRSSKQKCKRNDKNSKNTSPRWKNQSKPTLNDPNIDIGNDEYTVEKIISNIPVDLDPLKSLVVNAQGCCLLLNLKDFLIAAYSLDEAQIRNYSSADRASSDEHISSRQAFAEIAEFPGEIGTLLESYIQRRSADLNIDEVKMDLAHNYLAFRGVMYLETFN